MYSLVFLILTLGLFSCIHTQDALKTVQAVVGNTAELPCNVTAENEDDKLNILAWYRNGSPTAFYSLDMRTDGELTAPEPDARYKVVASEEESLSRLQILLVRASDAGLYHCLADFAESPAYKTYIQLVVIEPPQRLWVIHENGTRVATVAAGSNTSRNIGPYYIGDTVHLFCVAFGGKPQASMSWWTEQRLLKNTSTPLSEHRVRSDLMFGPLRREDHGRVLSCNANNNEHLAPLSIDIVIDMYLPPELVTVRVSSEHAGGRVHAGEALGAQCRVFGARPLPPVLWRLADADLDVSQNITMEPSQRMLISEIQLSFSSEHDESQLTCCAPAHRRTGDQFMCAQPLPLYVTYPPKLQILAEGELDNNTLYVVKGSNVTLNCTYQANPTIYELMWFHEEDLVPRGDGESSLEPILELRELTESDAGEYVCSATNDEGSAYSEPLSVEVTYSPYCEDTSIPQYGLAENESINITCKVKGNPEPSSFRWILVNVAANISTLSDDTPYLSLETEEPLLLYQRPNDTAFSTIFCWGSNGVESDGSSEAACTYMVTDETAPQPPADCAAVRTTGGDIIVSCSPGHDGGLPQKFTFSVKSSDSDNQLLSIISLEPKFIIQEPSQDNYRFEIVASNDKGDSKIVEIDKESIKNEGVVVPASTVSNITTLALALCGGVALVALAACGLVLCTHERTERTRPRAPLDPPLCAYNTDESNCETYHDSDDGSECNVRRTESFRRAVRYPAKGYDVRRTSSFHSARYADDAPDEGTTRCTDTLRHSASCRVHSLQNISRKRDMDLMSDQLIMHLPTETSYSAPKPTSTFYTMPRKTRHKPSKDISDEMSVITHASDGFSLPPPPDEFGTYRAATTIRDVPRSIPTYTTITRKHSAGKESKHQQYSNVIISPMNTVGLPTVSGAQSMYSYPADHRQGTQTAPGVLTSFQSHSSPKESGL